MTKEKRFLLTNKVDAKEVYNTIDYKDAFNHIRALADMEWNGKITLVHFRERIDDIITVIIKKELQKCPTCKEMLYIKNKGCTDTICPEFEIVKETR